MFSAPAIRCPAPTERHVYNRPGTRARKLGPQGDTRYLPGLSLCHRGAARRIDAMMPNALCSACTRRGEADAPRQMRYRLIDRQGSATLELDGEARRTGCEVFYPFGGTALRLASHQCETTDAAPRHSGKPCDISGLYSYGFRHYVPWLGRWISPDPAGTIDGLNLFAMVRNNPATLHDADGRMWADATPAEQRDWLAQYAGVTSRCLANLEASGDFVGIENAGSQYRMRRLGAIVISGLIATERALRGVDVREFTALAFIDELARLSSADGDERYQAIVHASRLHTTVYDVRLRDGRVSAINVDSYYAHFNSLMDMRTLTRRWPASAPPGLGFIGTDTQKGAFGCKIFSLSTALKMARHGALLDTLHDATLQSKAPFGLLAARSGTEAMPYLDFDKTVLPPAFFKHAQSRAIVDEVIRAYGDVAVNQRQPPQSLMARHLAYRPAQPDGSLGFSTSILHKQQFFVERAIAWHDRQHGAPS